MKKKIYYFSGTHWDREWYQTFQGFRLKLVTVFDELFEIFETDPSFECFYLDGQILPLEDYLEVRPENREKLISYIQKGKIKIGPWYCLPDEFLVSGEALIRNLNLGIRTSKEFGATAWKNGYVCDMFGHIAQLPQILNGVGIHNAILGRGTNENTTDGFFRWYSPNGSNVTVCKLPDNGGYGGFAMEVCGQLSKFVSLDADSEEFKEKAKKYIDHLLDYTTAPCAIIFDAMDHEPAHKKAPQYIKTLKEMYPDVDFQFGNIDECFDSLKDCNLQERKGELIDTSDKKRLHLRLITNTLSSRYPIKKRNDLCQNLLEKWLEPLQVLSKSLGTPIDKPFLKIAWKHLLQNHPHDSICGCSIDRVHDEMNFRFSQVESIVQACTDSIVERLTKGNQMIDSEHEYVHFINPTAEQFTDVIPVQIPFTKEFPLWTEPMGDQNIKAFKIFDEDNNEIEYVITDIKNNQVQRYSSENVRDCDIYTVDLSVTLKPFGLTRYHIVPQYSAVRYFGGMISEDGSMENDFIRVEIEPDGRITLYDKKQNITYPHLLGLIDDGDIGDGWWSIRPVAQTTSIATKLESVEILYNGNNSAAVKTVRYITIPEDTLKTHSGYERSKHLQHLKVETVITMRKTDSNLHIKTVINNTCKGHRLRMRIPTYTNSEKYTSSQTFCFVERDCGVDSATSGYHECEQLEKNTTGIVYRRANNGTGLAFISNYGLKECGCPKDKDSSILVTLYRSVGKTYTTNGEEGGQILQPLTFEYEILPLSDNISNADLKRLQNKRQQLIRSFVGKGDITTKNSGIVFKSQNCVIECLKECENSTDTVIRICNYSDKQSDCNFEFKNKHSVYLCNLLEEPITAISKNTTSLNLSVKPYQILTIKLCK